MMIKIPNILSAAELAQCRERLMHAEWQDGRTTAGQQATKVKANLQLSQTSADSRALGEIVMNAIQRNVLFRAAVLPRHISPPLFNKYEVGMTYGAHVDNAIRQIPGTSQRLRTDVSATLFLSDPTDFEGGELIVQDTYGAHRAKLPAGDLVLYPSTSLHRVAPVASGSRLAAILWVQSMVKDDNERALLFELDRSIIELSQSAPEHPTLVRFTAVYHNLVRKWSEM